MSYRKTFRKNRNFIMRWYHKKVQTIVEPAITEYLGFGLLIFAFSFIIVSLWNNPASINNRIASVQTTALRYGFVLDTSIVSVIVWFFILSGTFFVIFVSWLIYKLYFRTWIRNYVKRLEQQARLKKRRGKK